MKFPAIRLFVLILAFFTLSCEDNDSPSFILQASGTYNYDTRLTFIEDGYPILDYGEVTGNCNIQVTEDERIYLNINSKTIELQVVEVGDDFFTFNLPSLSNPIFDHNEMKEYNYSPTSIMKYQGASQYTNGVFIKSSGEITMLYTLEFAPLRKFDRQLTIKAKKL